MDYALIAGFEPTGDFMVRHWMRRLADHGVNDLYESFGLAPHITLSEFPPMPSPKLKQVLPI